MRLFPLYLTAQHLGNGTNRYHRSAGIHNDRLLVGKLDKFSIYNNLNRSVAVVIQVNPVARKNSRGVFGEVDIPVLIDVVHRRINAVNVHLWIFPVGTGPIISPIVVFAGVDVEGIVEIFAVVIADPQTALVPEVINIILEQNAVVVIGDGHTLQFFGKDFEQIIPGGYPNIVVVVQIDVNVGNDVAINIDGHGLAIVGARGSYRKNR